MLDNKIYFIPQFSEETLPIALGGGRISNIYVYRKKEIRKALESVTNIPNDWKKRNLQNREKNRSELTKKQIDFVVNYMKKNHLSTITSQNQDCLPKELGGRKIVCIYKYRYNEIKKALIS